MIEANKAYEATAEVLDRKIAKEFDDCLKVIESGIMKSIEDGLYSCYKEFKYPYHIASLLSRRISEHLKTYGYYTSVTIRNDGERSLLCITVKWTKG